MIILRDKTFSSPIPKSPNADKAYEKWKTSKDPKEQKLLWTFGLRKFMYPLDKRV